MHGSFRDDVGIEAVAEIDGVDVVAGAKLVKMVITKVR